MVLIASVSEKRELKFFAFYVTSGSVCEVEVAVVLPQDWQDLLHKLWLTDLLKLYSRKA